MYNNMYSIRLIIGYHLVSNLNASGAAAFAPHGNFLIPHTHPLQTTNTLAMGRYDFRPLRVHQTATQLLNTERISRTPPWYDVVGSITPAQSLVRTQPLPHKLGKGRPKTRKASKLFKPHMIRYEEDVLRKEFFKDHPWELARPRLVIENDGKDSQKTDWSRIEQSEKALSGER